MRMNKDSVREQAEMYRFLYQTNGCNRECAQKMIQPYIDLVNVISVELAEKYNQKPKKITFASYVR